MKIKYRKNNNFGTVQFKCLSKDIDKLIIEKKLKFALLSWCENKNLKEDEIDSIDIIEKTYLIDPLDNIEPIIVIIDFAYFLNNDGI